MRLAKEGSCTIASPIHFKITCTSDVLWWLSFLWIRKSTEVRHIALLGGWSSVRYMEEETLSKRSPTTVTESSGPQNSWLQNQTHLAQVIKQNACDKNVLRSGHSPKHVKYFCHVQSSIARYTFNAKRTTAKGALRRVSLKTQLLWQLFWKRYY